MTTFHSQSAGASSSVSSAQFTFASNPTNHNRVRVDGRDGRAGANTRQSGQGWTKALLGALVFAYKAGVVAAWLAIVAIFVYHFSEMRQADLKHQAEMQKIMRGGK